MSGTEALAANIIAISTLVIGLGTSIAATFELAELLLPASVLFMVLGFYGEFQLHTDGLGAGETWIYCTFCMVSIVGFYGTLLVIWRRSGPQRRSTAS